MRSSERVIVGQDVSPATMRVLHVYSGNLFGGIETMLLTMARDGGLVPAIEPSFALCFEGRLSAELGATGVSVHRLPEVRARHPLAIGRARRRLAAIIESGRFDRVVCHASWSQALFGGVVKRAKVPLVFWAHDVATGRHWTERIARTAREVRVPAGACLAPTLLHQ